MMNDMTKETKGDNRSDSVECSVCPVEAKIGDGCCLLLVPVCQTTTQYVECGYVRGVGNVYFALHDMHTII